MGELILCNYPIAAMPFYIDALSGNIYSLEELCYLIEHNLFLAEEEFFDEELFLWIEREVGAKELAEHLREAARDAKGIHKYVELLYRETGYWDVETTKDLIRQLEGLQHKSVLERRKIRADRYIESKKYGQGILEYRRILQMEECKKDTLVCGNIWHNLGVALARLFLFEEAKECFLKAYKYHRKIESVYAALAACRYLGAEQEIALLMERFGISGEIYEMLCMKWDEMPDEMQNFTKRIEEAFTNEDTALEENRKLKELLRELKKEYQRNRS